MLIKHFQCTFLSVSRIVMHLSCYISLLLINEISCSLVSIKRDGVTIVGSKLKTIFNNNMYSAFYRIPYAKPPIKELRFKPPKKIKPFLNNNTYDYSKSYTEKRIDEYCLYLSIFTPISSNESNLFPILVWPQHHYSQYGPDFFIDEEVLVVTVNFRSSIFSFLNTGDEFAEGNMGSKDILMALKWLQNNINIFNGDPNRVTIIGSGDASTSVASMILTTAAGTLFNRAIIMDGSALSPADYTMNDFEIANKLYWKLKGSFENFDRKELYSILNNNSATKLMLASRNLYDSTEVRDKQRLINPFTCSVEKNPKETAFILKSPVDIYNEKTINKVEVILGYTTLPLLFKLGGLDRNRKLLKYLNFNFQYLLPFEGKCDEYKSKRYIKIRKKILNFYFLNGTITEVSLKRYSKYVSDQVIYPLLRQAVYHTTISKSNVYLYRFSFNGPLNIRWRTSVPNLKWKGATLGDEICYLFRCKSETDIYNNLQIANERSFISRIVRLFANFAKCGRPTLQSTDHLVDSLKWLPLKGNSPLRAMNFGNNFKMVNVPEEIRMRFWNQLKEDYF